MFGKRQAAQPHDAGRRYLGRPSCRRCGTQVARCIGCGQDFCVSCDGSHVQMVDTVPVFLCLVRGGVSRRA